MWKKKKYQHKDKSLPRPRRGTLKRKSFESKGIWGEWMEFHKDWRERGFGSIRHYMIGGASKVLCWRPELKGTLATTVSVYMVSITIRKKTTEWRHRQRKIVAKEIVDRWVDKRKRINAVDLGEHVHLLETDGTTSSDRTEVNLLRELDVQATKSQENSSVGSLAWRPLCQIRSKASKISNKSR